MTNPDEMTREIEEAALSSLRCSDKVPKQVKEIEEAGEPFWMNHAMYAFGFHRGALWMLEHMKQKEMEKLADETLDD